MSEDLRFLFVPVSGRHGMGEYARSLAIAQAVVRRWPRAQIQFVLSREAAYSAGTPFPALLLPSSPTFHSAPVGELIGRLRPHVVVFDNAGRSRQLRAARRSGARIVYISARARQRRRAFRFSWMRLLDEHWIAYPAFLAGRITAMERLKLAIARGPSVRFLDVLMDPAGPPASVGGNGGGYVLMVPGAGTGHPGAQDSMQIFVAAARAIAGRGVAVRLVGPGAAASPAGGAGVLDGLRILPRLPQTELAQLMRGAQIIVANGGSTLLQGIACGRPCVAVAIAGDQARRIQRCVAAKVALAAPRSADAIADIVLQLAADAPARDALTRRCAGLQLQDGIEIAVQAIAKLVAASG